MSEVQTSLGDIMQIEIKNLKEIVAKLFNKLADEQQKLDSIRDLLRNAPIPLEEIPEVIAKILGGLNNE